MARVEEMSSTPRPPLHIVGELAKVAVPEEIAIAELCGLPPGRINESELARRWGWSRGKVRRRVAALRKAGRLPAKSRRKGRALVQVKGRVMVAAVEPATDTKLAAQSGRSKVPTLAAKSAGAMNVAGRPDDHPPFTLEPVRWHRRLPTAIARAIALLMVFAAAAAIAWYGVQINASYGESLGRTAEAGGTLKGLSISADMLALLLPPFASTLWLNGKRALAMVGWAIWAVTFASALMATVGFMAVNIADTTAARGTVAFDHAGIVSRIERLRKERNGMTDVGPVSAIEAQIERVKPAVGAAAWRSTHGCTDITRPESGEACVDVLRLRQNLATAQRRDIIDAELREAEARLRDLPPVTTANPQAETGARLVTWASVGKLAITPADVEMMRIAVMCLLPHISGFVVMLGVGVWQCGRQRS
jgi:hypothetical protein